MKAGKRNELSVELHKAQTKRNDSAVADKSLSEREIEVLQLIANGHTSSEIESKLFISENTVETHRKNIISTLKVRNMPEAVAIAMRKKLIK